MAEHEEAAAFGDAECDDDQLVAMAQIAGIVSAPQLVEAEDLCRRLKAEGIAMTLSEALVKKGFLKADQLAQLENRRRAEQFAESIPGYRLQAKLGSGAMGSVFKAYQKSMDRFVAVKILNPNLAKKPGFAERFLREAHASAKISHPHIIAGLDVGESRGLNYFVMELVEGEPLNARLARNERMGLEEGLLLAFQLASALAAIEQAGMVHRDLKPANILMTAKGQAKICDLGLSRLTHEDSSLTQEGHALGTPFYIAPEQVRGDKSIDARADQYALGATLYHLFTGQPLFARETGAATMAAHVSEVGAHPQTLRPDLPNGLVAILRKMLAKDRDHRYGVASELLHDLEEFKQGRPVAAFLFRQASSIPSGFVDASSPSDLELELPPEFSQPAGIAPTPVPLIRGGASLNAPVPADVVRAKHLPRRPRADKRERKASASLTTKLVAGGVLLAVVGGAFYMVSKASKQMEEAQEALNHPSPKSNEPSSAEPRGAEPPEAPLPSSTQKFPAPPRSAKTMKIAAAEKSPGWEGKAKAQPTTTHTPASVPSMSPGPSPSAPSPASPGGETQPPTAEAQPAEPPKSGNQTPAAEGHVTVLGGPKDHMEYRFDDPAELEDWLQADPHWTVSDGVLRSESKGLVQRLVWKKELAGDAIVTLTGYASGSLGMTFFDPAESRKQDRIILGGTTGSRVGMDGAGKTAPQWADFKVVDGRRHEFVIRRVGGKLTVQADGRNLISDVPGALPGTGRVKLELWCWEAGGVLEQIKIEGSVAP